MPELAYSALTAVIFTSAAGALVMCLLVFKYGFALHPDERPSAAVRRVFVTRLGHALAGTCFAVSAILAAVALADLAGVARPAAPTDDRVARDARLAELTSRLSAAESRLQRADERVRRVEAGLRSAATRPSVTPPPPAPVAPEPRVTAPVPPRAATVVVSPPAAFVAPSRPAARKSVPSDDLGSRLRRDWDAVKRSFATAGSDIGAALDEQLRGAGD